MDLFSAMIICRTLQTIEALGEEIATLRQENDALRQASVDARIDDLTGLYNRRWLRQFWGGLPSPGMAVSAVIQIDIDKFKLINDRYGHKIGDHAIIHVACALRRHCANVARTGGDEFVLLVPRGQSPEQVAEAVRSEVSQPMAVPGGVLTATISVGVAHLDETRDPMDLSGAIERADWAMYSAKHLGDRVVVA